MKNIIFSILSLSLFTSCSSVFNTPKYELSDGKYVMNSNRDKKVVYVDNEEDTIKMKSNGKVYEFPIESNSAPEISPSIHKNSLDIDILTILAKYRPKASDVPQQINANINANLYIGLRKDFYEIKYQKSPFEIYNRKISHFGISSGFFFGFGNTFVSPTTTQNLYNGEYDGIVFQKGIAGIIAIDKFTIGLGLGFDNLLNSHKKIWIYQNKPWLAVMLGLNLN